MAPETGGDDCHCRNLSLPGTRSAPLDSAIRHAVFMVGNGYFPNLSKCSRMPILFGTVYNMRFDFDLRSESVA